MVDEAVQAVVVADIITMVDMDTEIVTEIIATQVQETARRVGLRVVFSAVSSVAYSVLFSARMEHAKDVVKLKEKDHSIQIRSETVMVLKIKEMMMRARGRVNTVTSSRIQT